MNENNGFILKPEMYNQEEWYKMFMKSIETINNLQSKIDKANEILEKKKKYINDEELTWVEMPRKDYFEEIEEIENALKEDK